MDLPACNREPALIVQYSLLLLAGGFAAQHSRLLLEWDPVAALIVAMIFLGCMRRTRPAAVFVAGALMFVLAARSYDTARLDPHFEGDSMLTVVRVVDFPSRRDETVTLVVTPVADARLPRRSRISWFQPPVTPVLGDEWQFELRLRRPRGNSNPGGFDTEAWMLREDLHASGYVVQGKRNRLLVSGRPPGIDGIRYDIVRAVGKTATPGILAAITSGSRHALAPGQWDRFAATGTSHLMAISGLHVGLAAAAAFVVVYALSAALRLPGNHVRQAVAGGALLAAAYALISGFGVPAQRATTMLLIVAASLLCKRMVVPAKVLAAAAVIVFIVDPVASMTPGFHLSFGAVIALLWFAQRFRRRDGAGRGPLVAVRQFAEMQGLLLIALMPLTATVFQRVSLVAPVVNLVAVPLFSFITVPAALFGMVLLAVWPGASDLAFATAAESVAWVERWIAQFDALPFAALTLAGKAGPVLLLPLLWVLLPRGWPGRGAAVLAAILLLSPRPASPPPGCFAAHVLDVGQGLSVLVRTHRHSLLYDTGIAYRSGGSAARQIILPFLRYRGIERIDWLVVSHGDLDHAGGVTDLRAAMEVDRTIWNDADPDMNAFRCRAGQNWSVDGVSFRVLHPDTAFAGNGNDASCVVEVSAGERRMLLTGDIEASAETHLLASGKLRPAAIVVVPHHGSLTSSSPALVNALEADLAIASAGHANRWGFPKPRVAKRWQGNGARFVSTAKSGAISLRVCSWRHRSTVVEERRLRQRFWHDRVD